MTPALVGAGSSVLALWFVGLGFSTILRMPGRYVSVTGRALRSFGALLVRALRALARWLLRAVLWVGGLLLRGFAWLWHRYPTQMVCMGIGIAIGGAIVWRVLTH
jgi:hypothetical protein